MRRSWQGRLSLVAVVGLLVGTRSQMVAGLLGLRIDGDASWIGIWCWAIGGMISLKSRGLVDGELAIVAAILYSNLYRRSREPLWLTRGCFLQVHLQSVRLYCWATIPFRLVQTVLLRHDFTQNCKPRKVCRDTLNKSINPQKQN